MGLLKLLQHIRVLKSKAGFRSTSWSTFITHLYSMLIASIPWGAKLRSTKPMWSFLFNLFLSGNCWCYKKVLVGTGRAPSVRVSCPSWPPSLQNGLPETSRSSSKKPGWYNNCGFEFNKRSRPRFWHIKSEFTKWSCRVPREVREGANDCPFGKLISVIFSSI